MSKNVWEICVVMHKLLTKATGIILKGSDHHSPRHSVIVLPDSEFAESTTVASWNRNFFK